MLLRAQPDDSGPVENGARPKTDLVVLGGAGSPFTEHPYQAGQREPGNAARSPLLRPDGSTILEALRRRWLPALLLGTLFAVAAAVATRWFLPVKYTARVRFHIATLQPSVVFESNEGSADFANF